MCAPARACLPSFTGEGMSELASIGARTPVAAFPNERGNVARLAIAQALAGANASVIFATGAVVGNTLAPAKALATLPVTVFVVGIAAATLPAGALAQRFGRGAVFMLGTGC